MYICFFYMVENGGKKWGKKLSFAAIIKKTFAMYLKSNAPD